MKFLMSVIIPIYNSENHLKRCLDSLVCQNIENVELVLVNDGSTDGSEIIIEEYKKQYHNISVLFQENQGVSVARNNGIKIAKGEYLLFLDSDDVYSVGVFDKLKKTLENHGNPDMISFGYIRQGGAKKDTKHYSFNKYNNKIFSGIDFAKLFFLKNVTQNICSLLVKKKLLKENNISFNPIVKLGEDIAFQIKAMSVVSRVVYLADEYFIYNYNPDSQTNKKYGHSHLTCRYNYQDVYSFICMRKKIDILDDITFYYQYMFFYELHFFLNSDVEVLKKYLSNDEILYKKIKLKITKPMIKVVVLKLIYRLSKNILSRFLSL